MKLPANDKRWEYLEVDIDEIKNGLKKDKQQALVDLQQRLTSEDIVEIGGDIIAESSLLPLDDLQQIYEIEPERIKILLALMDFIYQKDKNVIKWKAEAVLGKSATQLKKAKPNYLCLLFQIFRDSPNHLMDIFVRNLTVTKTFKKFEPTGGKRSRPTIKINKLEEKEFQEILKKVDNRIKDNRHSHVWHIIREKESLEAYIRRQDEPQFLPLVDKNITEVLGKSFIVRVGPNAQRLELWAEKPAMATRVLDELAEVLFGKGARFEPKKKVNLPEKMFEFLDELRGKKIEELELLQVEIVNAPIVSRPELTLKNEEDLQPALDDLKSKEIDLFTDKGKLVSKLQVRFKNRKITLKIEQAEDGFYLRVSRFRGANGLLEALRLLLLDRFKLELIW